MNETKVKYSVATIANRQIWNKWKTAEFGLDLLALSLQGRTYVCSDDHIRETMTGITSCSTDLQRNDNVSNTVTTKKLLATLPNSFY